MLERLRKVYPTSIKIVRILSCTSEFVPVIVCGFHEHTLIIFHLLELVLENMYPRYIYNYS